MALQTAQVNGKAERFDAVRYTAPGGKAADFLVDDVFPAKNDRGVSYVLVTVDTGKYRVSDLMDAGWTFI